MNASAEPQDLGRQMAKLAREFYRPSSLADTLRGVTTAAVELVPDADCADVLVVTGRRKVESYAATSTLPEELDAVQEKLGEGPCLDAAYKNLIVRTDDLRTETRWPRFSREAVQAGVLSTLSFQLYVEKDSMGALNLFSFKPNAFDTDAEAITEVLAAQAAMALSAARDHQNFSSALASRDIIGQAKGMIMERFGVDSVRAFELLRKLSQDSNIALAEVASRIVEAGPAQLGGDPSA
ncbi:MULTISPECIES: GAF and ANTAR domain-containing protein [unclassified Rhodococcus (in: high G+C Gram-positive bacteria)]|jgi:transcriptional regulator with GAF, ATPase, and Fis domain|uniref:GAF and ANTAR domain-containing protein n=1 Tax=unclassified Rhodococcus (in: high G+C Gram-positive bacteria) TaxID=192944 RepID=UPI00146A2F38|nr:MULTISPECIES: GAF and ANTAR domain-containing protein [unclassified Rhodococcus (in: high G+C Gram-positive bacteria)]MBF0660787.1 GAF and ANTAR domain-containing protein [Rhodococcus sp. (in: high G+C Gram-positive bacteria)]NME79241.1 GAF and ANTAR domain-containing protein [Rhodococcus sp. 105337]